MKSSSKVLTFDNVGFKDGFEPSLNVLYNCHCLLFLQWCELHASYLGLQYPLLFPYDEDEYRNDIKHRYMNDSYQRKRNKVTIREFLCFLLQSKKGEGQTLLRSRRLFKQFIINGCTMMEEK